MKQHAYRARVKAIKRRERLEFEILEGYINENLWDPGPFGVYAKMLHPGVGVNDYDPPSVENAKARARELSNKFWPKREG